MENRVEQSRGELKVMWRSFKNYYKKKSTLGKIIFIVCLLLYTPISIPLAFLQWAIIKPIKRILFNG
jgi:hypothetical protein